MTALEGQYAWAAQKGGIRRPFGPVGGKARLGVSDARCACGSPFATAHEAGTKGTIPMCQPVRGARHKGWSCAPGRWGSGRHFASSAGTGTGLSLSKGAFLMVWQLLANIRKTSDALYVFHTIAAVMTCNNISLGNHITFLIVNMLCSWLCCSTTRANKKHNASELTKYLSYICLEQLFSISWKSYVLVDFHSYEKPRIKLATTPS